MSPLQNGGPLGPQPTGWLGPRPFYWDPLWFVTTTDGLTDAIDSLVDDIVSDEEPAGDPSDFHPDLSDQTPLESINLDLEHAVLNATQIPSARRPDRMITHASPDRTARLFENYRAARFRCSVLSGVIAHFIVAEMIGAMVTRYEESGHLITPNATRTDRTLFDVMLDEANAALPRVAERLGRSTFGRGVVEVFASECIKRKTAASELLNACNWKELEPSDDNAPVWSLIIFYRQLVLFAEWQPPEASAVIETLNEISIAGNAVTVEMIWAEMAAHLATLSPTPDSPDLPASVAFKNVDQTAAVANLKAGVHWEMVSNRPYSEAKPGGASFFGPDAELVPKLMRYTESRRTGICPAQAAYHPKTDHEKRQHNKLIKIVSELCGNKQPTATPPPEGSIAKAFVYLVLGMATGLGGPTIKFDGNDQVRVNSPSLS